MFLKYIQNTKTDFSKLAVLPRLAILLRPPLQYILSDAQVGGFCIFQQNNILLLFFMIFLFCPFLNPFVSLFT